MKKIIAYSSQLEGRLVVKFVCGTEDYRVHKTPIKERGKPTDYYDCTLIEKFSKEVWRMTKTLRPYCMFCHCMIIGKYKRFQNKSACESCLDKWGHVDASTNVSKSR